VIDLDSEEDALLKAMKSKTRYNVRLAAKRGVGVRVAEFGELPRWYEIYEETSRRDRIAIHSEAYYHRLFEIVGAGADGTDNSGGGGNPGGSGGGGSPRLLLYLAEHDGQLLAGNIVLEWDKTATYLYGASSGLRRELMAPYLLQWEAMRQAMARGCARYDLFGIPPTPDPKHPMHGLYRFKTGFGGRILHRLGAWDYPFASGRYAVYRAAEGLRDYYYKVIRKRGR
jgi:lipid II:glycine glycyltransferase (peptidoglycan interpeptide bridge formation enzyme)